MRRFSIPLLLLLITLAHVPIGHAEKQIDNDTEPLSRANALIAAANSLDMPEERALASLEEAIQLLDQVLQDNPPSSRDGIIASELKRISANYLQARHFMKLLSYGYATEQTGLNFSRRLRMAEDRTWIQSVPPLLRPAPGQFRRTAPPCV